MSSRQESLSKTVEVQKEQLSRYESRLKDLVRAYKSLNREKEALETSLKALSSNKSNTAGRSSRKEKDVKNSDENESEEKESPEGQLATVAAAMQTLLAEKSKIESNYIADRKSMKADLDKTQSELKTASQQLLEVSERLSRCQRERDDESNNYTDMLRETQAVLCREREAATLLQDRLSDVEAELAARQADDASAQEIRHNADRWQSVMAEQAQALADREERACSLESHIAELSASLGRHQQQAVADRSSVHRLREQVARLEEELSRRPLLPAADVITNVTGGAAEEVEAMGAVPHQLTPTALTDSLEDMEGKEWQQEYRQLKEEFEKYKQRVVAARKKEAEPSGEVCPEPAQLDAVQRQRDQLRLKLRKTCEERDDLERTLREHISRMEKAEAELRLAHRSEVAALEATHRLQLQERDQQLAGQRARTAALLDEREAELRSLRRDQPAASAAAAAAAAQLASDQLAQLGLHKQEGHMLHYVQEAARKDKEISNLRRTKHQLESSMRQLQNKMLEREQRVQDSEEALQERIKRLELNASREGANLEYIKNIVVRYLVTSDAAQRAHILNAIGTALRFDAEELHRVRQCQPASWWPAPATAASHRPR